MGEKIKTLSKKFIKGNEIQIELNIPVNEKESLIIHLQTEKFRCELKLEDFILYSLTTLVAERNLLKIKGVINE